MLGSHRKFALLLALILCSSALVSMALAPARTNPGRAEASIDQTGSPGPVAANSGGTASASPAVPDVPRMEQVIQSSVSDQQFMGSVLVARANEIILDKGYGFANLEWSIPNSPSTKFRLGVDHQAVHRGFDPAS